VFTTYPVLPVGGFAFLVTLLGFVQCAESRTATRVAYLLLFLFVQATRIPLGDYAASVL
jgi:hypothetical protein